MEELQKEFIAYREKNNLTIEDCAKKLNLTEKTAKAIEDGTAHLNSDEITRLLELIKPKRGGKRLVKILDLIFRFSATVMGLVVLLLCINGYSNTTTLIALLSIGLACSAFTMLPKIDK